MPMPTNDPILKKEDLVTSEAPSAAHHVNSTDATRGLPLVQRAQIRKAELEAALSKLTKHDVRQRIDIQTALYIVESLLTGDTEHIDDVTSVELNRWLEHNKHLAETPW